MRRRVWQRWLAAAGPWRGWVVCPLLRVPELERAVPHAPPDPGVARALDQALRGAVGDAGGTAVVLDLDPVVGVELAARLSADRIAHPVLVLPRWPYTEAILPFDQLLQRLTAGAKRLTPPAERLANVVFVLDSRRDMPLPGRPARDRRADNRYRLSIGDLPALADLRAGGIRRVVKVTYR
jgi:hypothetical protein